VPATVRFVTVSVADLEAARRAWVEGVGMREAPIESLHRPEHEALWGLAGAERKSVTLLAGGVLLELVEYLRPRGRPRPEGYRICDQGFMNLAVGARSREELDGVFAEWVARGLRPTSPTPLEIGIFRVMYFDTPSGENVELLFPRRWAWSLTGFRPQAHYLVEETFVRAPAPEVWAMLADHDRLGEWSAFPSQLLEPGGIERHGTGALRRVRVMGLSFDERVIHFDPPRRYSYEVVRGALVKRHRGDVVLTPEQGGTRVRWTIRLKMKLPGAGAVAAFVLRRKVRLSLCRLKDRLETRGVSTRRAAGPPR
jgi:hypothetical protein